MAGEDCSVHVKKWGTFARAKVQQGSAAVSILTEVENQSVYGENIVISSVLDPAGKQVGKATGIPVSLPAAMSIASSNKWW